MTLAQGAAIFLLFLLFLTGPASAQSWGGNLSLGFLRNTGNAKATTLNAKAKLDLQDGRWVDHATAQAASTSTDGNTTAEQYLAANKVEYDFTKNNFVFGSLSYANDRFASVLERYSESVGYGRRLLNTESQKLDVDVGVGANQERLADNGSGFSNEPIGTFDVDYRWRISPNARLEQTLHVEGGQRNVFVNPATELKLTITGSLFATIDYEVRYNSTALDGRLHTDTITSVNLGYSFGKQENS